MPSIPRSTIYIHEDVTSLDGNLLVNKVSVVRVDIVVGELSRGHLALEHDVHLLECAVLRLWQAEETPDGGEQRQASPEKGL